MSEKTVYTFRLQDVITHFGTIELTGWGEGDVLVIEVNPDWAMKVYADGGVTRSATNDRSAIATLKIAQCSASNALLEAARVLDQATGRGIFVFSVTDLNQGEELVGRRSWIEGRPRKTFGAEAGEREWKIHIARLQTIPLPGQSDFQTALEDLI